MSIQRRESWLQRLYRRASRLAPASPEPVTPSRPADVSTEPAQVTTPRAAGLSTLENWRDLVHHGRRVTVAWDGGPRRGTITSHGDVRLLFEDAVWVWLDGQLAEGDRPTPGQAMQLLAPGGDALRVIPCQDGGQPLTPVVDVLVGGQLAQGRFCPMPERERRRIVQFVYRQELVERQRAQAAAPAD